MVIGHDVNLAATATTAADVTVHFLLKWPAF